VIAAGPVSTISRSSTQRQNRRIEEVLHEIDAGDFVALVIRHFAQRLTSSRSHSGVISAR
jgi:hypothetical protein